LPRARKKKRTMKKPDDASPFVASGEATSRGRRCAARTTRARFGGSATWFSRRPRDGDEGAGGVALRDRASLS
jgi:hypothetical protein